MRQFSKPFSKLFDLKAKLVFEVWLAITVVASMAVTWRFSVTAAIFGPIELHLHFKIDKKVRIYIHIFLFAARLYINCELSHSNYLGGGEWIWKYNRCYEKTLEMLNRMEHSTPKIIKKKLEQNSILRTLLSLYIFSFCRL